MKQPGNALPPRCNRRSYNPEKNRKPAKKEKTGSVGKSTLPGVEVEELSKSLIRVTAPIQRRRDCRASLARSLNRRDCPLGSVSWRDCRASLARNLNLRTAPLERSHCSFRLIRSPLFRLCRTAHCADVRLAHPRPYRPRVRIPATDKQKWESPVKGAPIFVSKWGDSNPRPFGPEPNALPNCATPRRWSR